MPLRCGHLAHQAGQGIFGSTEFWIGISVSTFEGQVLDPMMHYKKDRCCLVAAFAVDARRGSRILATAAPKDVSIAAWGGLFEIRAAGTQTRSRIGLVH